MSEEKNNASVIQTGSAEDLIKSTPGLDLNGNSRDPEKNTIDEKEFVPKTQFKELEKKLGEQGNELGEYRNFFNELSPLLEKLDSQPDLTKAILEDKISPELIKSVSEGKISLDIAKNVSKANEAIKKEMGEGAYKAASAEDIEKKLSEKFEELTNKAQEKIEKITSQAEEISSFKKSIDDFISSTKDFKEYAIDIDRWFKEHPEQHDVRIAYSAVKGEILSKKQAEEDAIKATEAAKEIAANAGAGRSNQTGSIGDKSLIDTLIAGKSNPNIF